jgi:hypothetical protein
MLLVTFFIITKWKIFSTTKITGPHSPPPPIIKFKKKKESLEPEPYLKQV